MPFKKLKESLSRIVGKGSVGEDYIEIDLSQEDKKNKILVKPFLLKQFEDVNPILNSLREGYTIAIIDIKPIKNKDIVELKRAVSKIKKTVEALEGDIAGFGENILIVTPQFATIHKGISIVPKSVREDVPKFERI